MRKGSTLCKTLNFANFQATTTPARTTRALSFILCSWSHHAFYSSYHNMCRNDARLPDSNDGITMGAIKCKPTTPMPQVGMALNTKWVYIAGLWKKLEMMKVLRPTMSLGKETLSCQQFCSMLWSSRTMRRTRASSRNIDKICFLPSEVVKKENLSSFLVHRSNWEISTLIDKIKFLTEWSCREDQLLCVYTNYSCCSFLIKFWKLHDVPLFTNLVTWYVYKLYMHVE